MNKLFYPVVSFFITLVAVFFLLFVAFVVNFTPVFVLAPLMPLISVPIAFLLTFLFSIVFFKTKSKELFYLIHSFIITLPAIFILISFVLALLNEPDYFFSSFFLISIANLLPVLLATALFPVLVKAYLSKGNQRIMKGVLFLQVISFIVFLFIFIEQQF